MSRERRTNTYVFRPGKVVEHPPGLTLRAAGGRFAMLCLSSLATEFPSLRFQSLADYPDYAASDDGTIWFVSGNEWIPRNPGRDKRRKCGYLSVNIQTANGPVTRPLRALLLETFVGPRPDGCWAGHRSGGPIWDNRLSHIAWLGPIESIVLPGGPLILGDAETLPVPGWPGYRAGRDGSVWSCRNSRWGYSAEWKRMQPRPKPNGYLSVTLCAQGRHQGWQVHRLVLTVFVGPCPPGKEGCHFPDPDRSNCRLDNLMWGTVQENRAHSKIHGTLSSRNKSPFAHLTHDDVRCIRRMSAEGYLPVEIALAAGITSKQCKRVLSGECWGYVK